MAIVAMSYSIRIEQKRKKFGKVIVTANVLITILFMIIIIGFIFDYN